MKRFILTGSPGAGKTVILRQLELEGFGVVEEAATDVIAIRHAQGIFEPWLDVAFINDVVALQKQRQIRAAHFPDVVQIHDRSAFCTAALAIYLGYPASSVLTDELGRLKTEKVFEKGVLFVRNLGFVAPTGARRISLEEALRFERIHAEVYLRHGFEITYIEPGILADRVEAIKLAMGVNEK